MKLRDEKSLKLDSILKDLGSFVVAFSGGVDSTFLLHRAHAVNKPKIIGITIRTPYIPSVEIKEAIEFTSSFGIRHKAVSYTHLRAHETDSYLVCRLLLEK